MSPGSSSLSNFIRGYVGDNPTDDRWVQMSDIPAKTELSDRISKDMKKPGFKFVGSTIIYRCLQAVGVVNDHIESCAFRGVLGHG
jgi:DNA-3-methyladenine glycosylase I